MNSRDLTAPKSGGTGPTSGNSPGETDYRTQPNGTPVAVAVHRGILHCRQGEWHSGLHYLLQAEGVDTDVTLPGLYYSYLGHALARCERRYEDATDLCERGVALQFHEPETFVNLAWTHMLAHDRKRAAQTIARAIKLHPRNTELKTLAQKIGLRRPPVLGFLPRTHPLNRWLGQLRHGWMTTQRAG